jgi:acylphosphatase
VQADAGGMLAPMRRVRLTIRGQVQGVSYRANATDAARRLGVSGWVRNQPDGSVLLEAQGPADQVALMIDWCNDGPPHARVDDVKVIDVPIVNAEKGFTIER